MPLVRCRVDGKGGWRWGEKGKCFVGSNGRSKALRQARAVKASQAREVENEPGGVGGIGNGSPCLGTLDAVHGHGSIFGSGDLSLNVHKRVRTQIVRSNVLKADPTRTKTLRRAFEAEFTRRFRKVARAIVHLLTVEDAFGLKRSIRNVSEQKVDRSSSIAGVNGDSSGDSSVRSSLIGNVVGKVKEGDDDKEHGAFVGDSLGRNNGRVSVGLRSEPFDIGEDNDSDGEDSAFNLGFTAARTSSREPTLGYDLIGNQRFEFLSTVKQKEAFEKWLEREMAGAVLTGKDAYWEEFIRQGYAKGAGRAFDDTRAVQRATAITSQQVAFMEGSKQQFLLSAFGRPESIEKVQLLASRVFTDLKGVSSAMSTQLSRVLVDGLTQGQHPMVIARAMVGPDSPLQKIGINRARMIARTETIRAHAEGTLDGLEKLGVDKVGVMVEWSTAGDDRVCPLCMPLEGVVLKIKEARGIIPRHPNCVVGESVIVADDVIALMKTHYAGEIIEISTAKGRSLSVTPNHILLTEYGFLPARFAYEGLKIIDATGGNSDVIVTPDNNAGEPCIAHAFATLRKYPAMLSKSMPLTPENLHGDGGSCNPEIDIVYPDRELWNEWEGQSLKDLVKLHFPFLHLVDREPSLSLPGSDTQFLERIARSFDSSMGVCRDLLALLLGHLLHTKIHGLTTITGFDVGIFQTFINDVSATPESLCESIRAHPILKQIEDLLRWNDSPVLMRMIGDWLSGDLQMPFDSLSLDFELPADDSTRNTSSMKGDNFLQVGSDVIASLSVSHVSNLPVYDVQTKSTVYQVNGLLTSNCRCTFVPANVGEGAGATRKVNFGDGVIDVGQKRSKKEIQASFRHSVSRERVKGTFADKAKKSRWVGADKVVPSKLGVIAKVRPEASIPPVEKVKPKVFPKPPIKAAPKPAVVSKPIPKLRPKDKVFPKSEIGDRRLLHSLTEDQLADGDFGKVIPDHIVSSGDALSKAAEKDKKIREAIWAYTNKDSKGINKALRGGKALTKKQQALVDSLDKVTKEKLAESTTTYRGLGKTSDEWLRMAETILKEGKGSIVDEGFVSTSLNPAIAAVDTQPGRRVLLQIRTNNGAFVFGESALPAEFELLLQRSRQYRVLGIDKAVTIGESRIPYTVIRLEDLPWQKRVGSLVKPTKFSSTKVLKKPIPPAVKVKPKVVPKPVAKAPVKRAEPKVPVIRFSSHKTKVRFSSTDQNKISQRLEKTQRELFGKSAPEIRGVIIDKDLGDIPGSISGPTSSSTSLDKAENFGDVLLHPDFATAKGKRHLLKPYDFREGFGMIDADSVEGIAVHEYGHLVHETARKINPKKYQSTIIDYAEEEIERVHPLTGKKFSRPRYRVDTLQGRSNVAEFVDAEEWIAENIADVAKYGSGAAESSKEVVKRLNRILSEGSKVRLKRGGN